MPFSPKPPTAMEAPLGISLTASAHEETTLSIRGGDIPPRELRPSPEYRTTGDRIPMAAASPHHASSDEEAMILDVVRDLVAEKVAPRAAEIDERGEYPQDIRKIFAENDLLGIPIPAEYGGVGGTFLTYVKVVEEIAKACASSSLIVAVQELGMLPILIGGSDEQKKAYLPKLASGEWIAAYALTEAGSGSDAAGSMRTRAEKRGDTYVLNGQKIWITNGSVADVVCVFAVTDPEKGAAGISAFIVEKGFKGFSVGKLEKKMGIRGSPTVELVFEGDRKST